MTQTRNKIEDIRAREEARREARKARQRGQAKSATTRAPAFEGTRTLVLALVSRDQQHEAYRRLEDPILCTYFKKYRYHEPKQLAVMCGSLMLPDLPADLYTTLLSRLTREGKCWKQGRLST